MKKSTFIYAAALSVMAALPSATMAVGFEAKAGVSSVRAANDKAAVDAAIALDMRLERFFAFVPELNVQALGFDSPSGTPVVVNGINQYPTVSKTYYTFIPMANMRLYIPMGSEDTPAVQPYITAGLGFGYSMYNQKNPDFTDSASGFMYQGMLGAMFNLGMLTEGSASATNLMLEAGYRGGQMEKSGAKADWNGYVIRAGVNFQF
ncbi:MAG TPA: outer membrane beta-barrel protein [Turneriella sp.]|nr:outer membrane beta-barrel protein [Turneriella sp.]HNL11320.1 outer membrane beta-barrel protein [Turneriella sp.]